MVSNRRRFASPALSLVCGLLLVFGCQRDAGGTEIKEAASYVTAAIVRDQVLVAPAWPAAMSDAQQEDILQVYPLGTVSQGRFSNAAWTLRPDGAARLALRPDAPGHAALWLDGGWTRDGSLLRLHLSGTAPHDLALSFDGLLLAEDGKPGLEGVYSVEVQGAHHVESVAFRLAPTQGDAGADQALPALRLERPQSQAGAPAGQPAHRLSQPDQFIGGVPVPTVYDIVITGQVDGRKFGPAATPRLTGTLLLLAPTGKQNTEPDVLVTTSGAVVAGWSTWTTMSQGNSPGASLPEPGVAVEARDGNIRVRISPAPPLRPLEWYASDPDRPDETTPVLVDTATLDLRVDGINVSGTLQADGHLLTGSREPSHFVATISGHLQGGQLIGTLVGSVGIQPFDGRWHEKILGRLDLRQQDRAVTGKSDTDAVITGTADGQLLDMNLTSAGNDNRDDRGFLRAVRDGSLVGMVWNHGNPTGTVRPVIALRNEGGGNTADAQAHPVPTSKAEAIALKNLGYDYARAGKHRDAVDALSKALYFFRACASNSGNDFPEWLDCLVSQGLPAQALAESAFDAGDYRRLLEGLTFSLDLQENLSDRVAGPRAFRHEAETTARSLRDSAQTIGLLADAFGRGRDALTTGKVGLTVEAAPKNPEPLVSQVAPGKPAALAGLAAGDRVLAIDGVATQGLATDAVVQLLRGAVGSVVSVVVARGNEQRTVQLKRVTLVEIAPERQVALIRPLSAMQDFTRSAQRELDEAAHGIGVEADPAALKSAFETLLGDIASRRAWLAKARAQALALASDALRGRPETVAMLRTFADLSAGMAKEPQDAGAGARLVELDRQVDEFRQASSANRFDADLLEMAIAAVGQLDTTSVALRGRARLTEQRGAGGTWQRPDAVVATLTSLSANLDRWRDRLATDAGKIDAVDEGQAFFRRYVDLLVRLGSFEQALVASEAARARAFLDLLDDRNREAPAVTASKKLADPPAALTLTRKPGNASERAIQQLADLKETVRRQGAPVIEYFRGEKQLFIWVVAPDGHVTFRPSPVVAAMVEAEAAKLAASLDDPASAKKDVTLACLSALYDALVRPVADLLPPSGVVTIVPHDELFRVPFAALRDASGNEGKGRFLVEDRAVVQVPSIAILQRMQALGARPRTATRSVLALVDPAFPPNLLASSGQPLKPIGVPPTDVDEILDPYAEARRVILRGSDATGKNLQNRSQGVDVVLLLTHAEAFDSKPRDSYIALADGKFTTHNVEKLHLDAELVILGACQTGSGQITGDGVNGLSRFFVAAGASSLLTNLWAVPKPSTVLQLVKFNQAWLNRGQTKAEALREAQLQALKRYPYDVWGWAGFVLVGNWR